MKNNNSYKNKYLISYQNMMASKTKLKLLIIEPINYQNINYEKQ